MKTTSNLIYNADQSFYKYYRNSKNFDKLFIKSKHFFLVEFFKELHELNNSNSEKESTKVKKVNDNASDYIMSI